MEGQEFEIKNKRFQQFLDCFPVGNFPFRVNAEVGSKPVSSHPAIPSELVKEFICEPANSELKCGTYPGEAEDQNPLHYFFPFAKLLAKETFFLFYQLNYQGFARLALATYNKNGEMLSRILFAGHGKRPRLISGTLSANLTVQVTFHEPNMGSSSFFDSETKNYRINGEGYLQPVLMSQSVKDNFY